MDMDYGLGLSFIFRHGSLIVRVLYQYPVGFVDFSLRQWQQGILILIILSGSLKHLLGNAPTHEVVEAIGFQTKFYTAFVADGIPQFALVGGGYFGQNICQGATGMCTYLFQIVEGFGGQAFSLAASAPISNTSG